MKPLGIIAGNGKITDIVISNAKKHGWKEEDIPDLVHRFRKSKT